MAGVGNHARETVSFDHLPLCSECRAGHVADGTQVEGLFGNWGADTSEVSLCSEEHGDEAGLAHSSRPVDEKHVVFVGNVAIAKSSL